MKYCTMKTPIGVLMLIEEKDQLVAIDFCEEENQVEAIQNLVEEMTPFLKSCCGQLEEYFNGERVKFNIPLFFEGTHFQKCVWNTLMEIPYGETASYKQIAEKMEKPKAMRAVGNANHNNKIPIIIPCHRVIGANGKMVGYAGGLWRKEWLLNHEMINNRGTGI